MDLAFLALLALLVAGTFGLIVLCERLAPPAERRP